jgi:hypothetical protein
MRYSEFSFGPYFSADLVGPDGRLTRLHKGGGVGDGGVGAMMAQNQKNFEAQMALMKQQADQKIPDPPKYDPQSAAPTSSNADVAASEDQARRDAAKRRSMQAAVVAGETKLGGQRTLLG